MQLLSSTTIFFLKKIWFFFFEFQLKTVFRPKAQSYLATTSPNFKT